VVADDGREVVWTGPRQSDSGDYVRPQELALSSTHLFGVLEERKNTMISIQNSLGNLLDSERPLVVLKKLGFQEGFGTLPGRWLYNVISGDYAHGSTVTIESMKMRGFRVEVVS